MHHNYTLYETNNADILSHEDKVIEKDGIYEILSITRYGNGQTHTRKIYRNGKREGCFNSWYKSGKIMMRAFHRDDKMDGETQYWNENGKIWVHGFYRDGNLIDQNFNLAKKLTFLRILKHSRKWITNPIKCLLISDLMKIVIHFV